MLIVTFLAALGIGLFILPAQALVITNGEAA